MATLVCCAGCERFVNSLEDQCPFCGIARAAKAQKLRRTSAGRAAVVALALAAGCNPAPAYGGPPPEEDPPAESEGNDTPQEEATTAAQEPAAPDEQAPDEQAPDEQAPDEQESGEQAVEQDSTTEADTPADGTRTPMPAYGGPPPRNTMR